jgi:protein transport protein SEC61 subunit gamma-like protein
MTDDQQPPAAPAQQPAAAPEPAPESGEPEMEMHEPAAAPSGPGFMSRLKANLKNAWLKLGAFTRECIRVVRITKKPDKAEYTTIVKISGIGILVIGFIGFILHAAKELLF